MTTTTRFLCRSCGGVGRGHAKNCPRRRPPANPCRHCGVHAGCHGRGLCRHCHADPVILVRYPRIVTRITPRHVSALPPKPKRKPGDGTHRCLWCSRWRCNSPLKLCEACQQDYHARAVGMPELRSGEGVT